MNCTAWGAGPCSGQGDKIGYRWLYCCDVISQRFFALAAKTVHLQSDRENADFRVDMIDIGVTAAAGLSVAKVPVASIYAAAGCIAESDRMGCKPTLWSAAEIGRSRDTHRDVIRFSQYIGCLGITDKERKRDRISSGRVIGRSGRINADCTGDGARIAGIKIPGTGVTSDCRRIFCKNRVERSKTSDWVSGKVCHRSGVHSDIGSFGLRAITTSATDG